MIDEETRRVWSRPFRTQGGVAQFGQELMQAQPGEAAGLSRFVRVPGRGGDDVSLLVLWRVGSALGLPVVELLNPDREAGSGNR